MRSAIYLDMVDENPLNAIEHANGKFDNICLRRCWTNDICDIPDNALPMIKDKLGKIQVLLVTTFKRSFTVELIDRLVNIARFYRAKHIVIPLIADDLLEYVSVKSIDANILPLIEPTGDIVPANLALTLKKFKRIKLLLDPASIVMNKRVDVFTKFWSLFKNDIKVIEVRDYKTGVGPRHPGFGDAMLDTILSDAKNGDYTYTLEPNLVGPRRDMVNNLELYIESLNQLLRRIGCQLT